MSLDINTPKGRACAADQIEAMRIVYEQHPEFQVKFTSDTDGAVVDVFICKGNHILSTGEIKARHDMNYQRLMGERRGEWLLTMKKLTDMGQLCKLLCIPGYGYVYLPSDRLVLAVILCDRQGRIVCKYRTERTETQASINGGVAHRINAFIRMDNARKYRDND